MKRFLLPIIGILAALWAAYSVARTTPRRHSTNPPAAAPGGPQEQPRGRQEWHSSRSGSSGRPAAEP